MKTKKRCCNGAALQLSKPTFRISQVTEHFQTEINFLRIVTGERTDRGQTFHANGASGG